MYSNVYSAAICGLEAHIIQVEADVSNGLPVFNMVGFLASEVKEARERVRISLQNSGYRFPAKRITVNLSPADLRKDGSGFDLPIAISLLATFGMIPKQKLNKILAVGELSLDGTIGGVHGALAMALMAKKQGFQAILLPQVNSGEAGMVEGIDVIGVRTLSQVIRHLKGEEEIAPVRSAYPMQVSWQTEEDEDFDEVYGQEEAKRALEIAVSGGHNILMIGAPGTGKTMLAKRVQSILPELSREEAIQVTKIYGVAGLLNEQMPYMAKRPFRSPHHTITATALAGGGRHPIPGEITLAHNGVLFLDELPEFSVSSLEILRQPMEEGEIHISRLGRSFVYPSKTIVIGAMNPCKCGFYPDLRKCRCSPMQIKNYLAKLSEPLLDRVDLCVEMQRMTDISRDKKNGPAPEKSWQIKERVCRTRERQKKRYAKEGITLNSELKGRLLKKYCAMGKKEQDFLQELAEQSGVSVRGMQKILRVARTLADMEEADDITETHLLEASTYKTINKRYWDMEQVNGGRE